LSYICIIYISKYVLVQHVTENVKELLLS